MIAEHWNGIAVFPQEPLAKHTTFRVGGPADWLVCPKNETELVEAFHIAAKHHLPVTVIGNGSNLLVRDGGIRGAVIRYEEETISCQGTRLTCGAGALLSRVANEAVRFRLTGLEFAAGIPGSIGGGIRMNAGAYGGELCDLVVSSRYLDTKTGTIHELEGENHQFSYRHSIFCDRPWMVLQTTLQLSPGDPEQSLQQMAELAQRRREKQPLSLPSAGSTFKRPPGYFAGALIDQCGLRGYRVGDAQVSEKHAGFIVNTGRATAAQLLELMQQVQEIVQQKHGVLLEPEVCILGEDA